VLVTAPLPLAGQGHVVADAAGSKRVHHLRSRAEMAAFLDAIKREYASV
jgi:hypothetical protein